MKLVANLLIALTLITQVDDGTWALAAVLPVQTTTDDDFLTTHHEQEGQPTSRREQQPANLSRRTGRQLTALSAGVGPADTDHTGPFGPPPLYVFMSLQR